jgi:hypothetical protein
LFKLSTNVGWAKTASCNLSANTVTLEFHQASERCHDVGGPETTLDCIFFLVLENAIGYELSDEEKEEVSNDFRRTLGTIAVLFAPSSVVDLAHEGFCEDLARQNVAAQLSQLQLRFRRRHIWVSVIAVGS